MGTEGRREGENELAATDNVLGQVKFRVDMIKTFNIIEKPEEEEEDEEEEDLDPAIIEQTDEAPAENKPPKSQNKRRDDWSRGTKVNATGSVSESVDEEAKGETNEENSQETEGYQASRTESRPYDDEKRPYDDEKPA